MTRSALMLSRRRFLASATATAVSTAVLARPLRATAQTAPRALRYPELIDATQSRRITLTAAPGRSDFDAMTDVATAGFNAAYLGPVLRLSRGETEIALENAMAEEISAHWHGLIVPGEVDGGPHQPVAPGTTWKVVLPIAQDPAPLWFHSHIHGRTGPQVYAGLAGMMQIADGRDGERGLPTAHGVDDLPIILQDKRFDDTGEAVYNPSMHDRMMGFLGNAMVVNGQVGATAVVPPGLIRLRLLNGSNARIYDLHMRSGQPLMMIASDGGFLPAPVALDRLLLGPGERAEVLIDLTGAPGDSLLSGMVDNSMMGIGIGEPFEVLPFVTDASLGAGVDRLPEVLGGTLPSFDTAGTILRRIALDTGGMGGGMMSGMMGHGPHGINGRAYEMDRIDFTLKQGEVQRWRIEALSMMHPFHVHGVQFQVLSENGAPPAPRNLGWKDTVLVSGMAEIAMRFVAPAPDHAPYMYHCHILEHEDGGMMGQFAVS